MALRHISQVIGDPNVFVDHMVKDAMRRADETLPPPDKSDEELNKEVFIEQWEEENKCKTILIGQDGAHPRQKKSSEMLPHSTTTAFAKKQITQWGNDVF
jgi:hypothetical protein